VNILATSNKDFKIKNGLIVEGDSATVNGNDVLTSASSIDELNDVSIATPENNQVLAYEASTSSWKNVDFSEGSKVVVSPTPPTDPAPTEGTQWFDSSNGTTYIYYDDFWVPVSPPIAGPPGPTGEPGIVVSNDEPLDTNVVWLDSDDPAISAIPAGGTTGQVLAKATNDNYNTEWTDLNTADISDLTASATAINSISSDTTGYTALSNGTSGITYQPISPNAIINGAFDFWQRGTSFSANAGVYTADRWALGFNSSTVTRSTDTPTGSGFSAIFTRSAGTVSGIRYRMESNDSKLIKDKTVTVSWWAKEGAADNSTFYIDARYANAIDNFTTVTNFIVTTPDPLTTTWQRFSKTITLPSDVSNGLELYFITSGINKNYFIADVQLELGSVATPFKRNAPSLALEEMACFRYAYAMPTNATYNGSYYTTTQVNVVIPFPTEMRTAPSLSQSNEIYLRAFRNNAGVTTSSITLDTPSTTSTNLICVTSSTTTGASAVVRKTDASALVIFSAEL
jgi:hypothetical protein